MASNFNQPALETLRSQRDRLLDIVGRVAALGALKLPLDALLREVVVTAQQLTRGTGAAVSTLDDGSLEYRAASGCLEAHQGLRVPVQGSLSGLALMQRELVYSADTGTDPRTDQEPDRPTGPRAVLVAPLLHGVDAEGVLKVVSDHPDAFDEVDEHAVRMCAQFVAGVLARQQALEEQARLAEEHAAALVQVRTVLAASPVAIVVHDLDGRIRMWNPAAEYLLGWTEAEVLGKLPPFVPADRMAQFAEYTRRIVAGEHDRFGPVDRQRKDGSRVRLRISGAALRDPAGIVTGVVRVLEAAD